MAASNIISIYFELGLGVHLCLVSKKNIVICLISVGFLTLGADQYVSVECTRCLIIKDPFKKLPACTIGLCMLNAYIIVDMLILISEKQTIGLIVATLSVQPDPGIVSYNSAMKGYAVGSHTTVGFLVNV
jgi:hypothetical protein